VCDAFERFAQLAQDEGSPGIERQLQLRVLGDDAVKVAEIECDRRRRLGREGERLLVEMEPAIALLQDAAVLRDVLEVSRVVGHEDDTE
jgi:hypothetical protein